jgi:lipid II:glycine glycyltransferase (peptidoglycan interpeptide bridge formation enzyme)
MAKLVNLTAIELRELEKCSLFQSEFWAKVKKPVWQAFAFSFSIEDRKGTVLVLVRTFCHFFSLAYIPFGPVGITDTKELKLFSKALKTKLSKKVFLLRFDLPYKVFFNLSKDFKVCKESVQAEATVQIALPQEFSLRLRAKRNINKTKAIFTVAKAESEEEILAWYECYKQTGVRDGFSTRSFSYIKKLLAIKTEFVNPILYVAKAEGKVVGGILNLRSQKEEIYLFGATLKTDEGLSPGYLMQEYAISEAIKAGVAIYDLFGIEGKEGRGEHLKSLTLFKTAFGGNKCYRMPTVDYYCHSLIAKAYRFFEAIRYHHYR